MAEVNDYLSDEKREQVAGLIVGSVLKNLSKKVWLSGIADLTQAIEDPERYSEPFLGKLAGAVVPTFVAQIARTTDPVLRKARAPIDRIKSRIPGVSKSLPARTNMWGQPRGSEGGLGPDSLSPIWTRTRKNDPINLELLRLRAGIGLPQRTIKGVKLTPQEYSTYSAETGRLMRSQLQNTVGTPGWKQMTDDARRNEADTIAREARQQARHSFIARSPRVRGMIGSRKP